VSDKQPIEQKVEAQGGSTVKNVIQAVIQVSAWAWVAGILILAVAMVLAAGIFNIGPLHALLPPTPTPMAFRPSNGESLIIVADFDDRSGGKYQGIDPAQYIYEQLKAQANQDQLDVRIERLCHIVNDNTVRKSGEVYRATLVLWGWYDALTVTPRMERIKTGAGYRSTEEGQHLSLADPAKVDFTIITDLPSQATYLTLFTLGMEKYASGDADQATAYLDSALAAIPQKVAASTNPSETYFYRGIIYYEKSNYERAIADLDQAIQLKPDYALAHNNRGVAYGKKGDYDLAIADLDQAIQLDSGYAYAYNNRGSAYDATGDYERAIADLDQAIQLKPDYAEAYYNRGSAYYNKGDYDLAIADFNKVIQLDPDDAEAYNNRGSAYYKKGDYQRAIADYDQAIQLQPDYADAYFSRGAAYRLEGNKDEAIADFETFLELSNDPYWQQQAEAHLKELGAR
jgi:tetratricopeptide (TPR) repeat protein